MGRGDGDGIKVFEHFRPREYVYSEGRIHDIMLR